MEKLTIEFQQENDPSSQSLSGLSAIRMEGSLIRETRGGPVLARHEDHRWRLGLDGKKYFRLDCADLVSIQMEDGERRSEKFGPYTHFSSADGVAFADRELFAHLDEKTDLWSGSVCAGEWAVLIVTPAAQIRKPARTPSS